MAILSAISSTFHGDGRGRYPFVDTATLISVEGVRLPPEAFVDACVYPSGAVGPIRLTQINVAQGSITVYVGDDTTADLCHGTLDMSGTSVDIPLFDDFERPCGIMVGDLRSKLSGAVPEGVYKFDAGASEFAPTCVVPVPSVNLEGFLLPDGSFVSGDVWFVGRKGVSLEVDETTNTIKVHVIGDPLYRQRQCTGDTPDSTYVPPTPLQKLQFFIVDQEQRQVNLLPNDHGGVTITTGSNGAADSVLRINPLEHGVQIKTLDSPGRTA